MGLCYSWLLTDRQIDGIVISIMHGAFMNTRGRAIIMHNRNDLGMLLKVISTNTNTE